VAQALHLIAEYADDPWTPLALHFSYTWGLDLSQSVKSRIETVRDYQIVIG
jgi:hypothetical protein